MDASFPVNRLVAPWWVSLCLVVALSGGCRQRTSLEAEAEIRAVLQDQVSAWNRGDLASFMEGYAKLDSTRFATGDTLVQGWQPVFDRYRRRYTNAAAMGHLIFFDVQVNVLSRDAAAVVGHWRLERTGEAPTGVFTLLFRLRGEGWRIVHDHTSSARP